MKQSRFTLRSGHGGMLAAAALALALPSCTGGTKSLGDVTPSLRSAPLTPGSRTKLEAEGATCFSPGAGPEVCTWSSNNANCSVVYDSNNQLTHLSCDQDGLSFSCVLAGPGFVCRWSDAPDCGQVYDNTGRELTYACGDALAAILGDGAGGGTSNSGCPSGNPPTSNGRGGGATGGGYDCGPGATNPSPPSANPGEGSTPGNPGSNTPPQPGAPALPPSGGYPGSNTPPQPGAPALPPSGGYPGSNPTPPPTNSDPGSTDGGVVDAGS